MGDRCYLTIDEWGCVTGSRQPGTLKGMPICRCLVVVEYRKAREDH